MNTARWWIIAILAAILLGMLAESCTAAPGDPWEVSLINRAAREYRLTPEQTRLLHAIRHAENGGAGLEFGVQQHLPQGAARRFARFPELSLLTQARWAAGTIRQHYHTRHDLPRFAARWVEPQGRPQWLRNVQAHAQ